MSHIEPDRSSRGQPVEGERREAPGPCRALLIVIAVPKPRSMLDSSGCDAISNQSQTSVRKGSATSFTRLRAAILSGVELDIIAAAVSDSTDVKIRISCSRLEHPRQRGPAPTTDGPSPRVEHLVVHQRCHLGRTPEVVVRSASSRAARPSESVAPDQEGA